VSMAVQVTDLLLGCVTADLNRQTRSATKLGLIDHLAGALGRRPSDSTLPNESKFNVRLKM
jgi:hypothetical protein